MQQNVPLRYLISGPCEKRAALLRHCCDLRENATGVFFEYPGDRPGSVRALAARFFILLYSNATQIQRCKRGFYLMAFFVCFVVWVAQRTPGDDANLSQYPLLIL
jgi:hypothetical protein